MSEQLGTCLYGAGTCFIKHAPHTETKECYNWRPVPAPAEPPHVACSCPMCCPAKHEINAALANAAEPVAGETQWSTILGKKDDAVVVASATADWKPPATAVAAPAEGKQVNRISVEVFQHDWIPGFAAFHDDGEINDTAKAHVVLNLGSLLTAIKAGEFPTKDLPYFVAECLMHEVIHVLEAWAGVEFSEERVEELLESYWQKYGDGKTHFRYEAASTPPPAATVSRDLEGKLRELTSRTKDAMARQKFNTGKMAEVNIALREAAALGRAEGLSDALKIIREYTYLDGRAGEMANLLEDRIEAIRALKEKV